LWHYTLPGGVNLIIWKGIVAAGGLKLDFWQVVSNTLKAEKAEVKFIFMLKVSFNVEIVKPVNGCQLI